MEREAAFEKLTEILRDIFDNETLDVFETTTAKDIDGWDSLMHLQIISEIEDQFGIKFTMGEIQGFLNVGDLLNNILLHLSSKS
ncbi:MAG: acyl carrier protein [Clostridiales Family XIII bacterium]|jgi:acyl carrier protein|nr:acyl carrier protein [Clostridiales Family XIII bacterium]